MTTFAKGYSRHAEQPYWDRAWLAREYGDNLRSALSIAREFGVDIRTIYTAMDKYGIPRRSLAEAARLREARKQQAPATARGEGEGQGK